MQKGDVLVKLLLVWGVDCIASVAFKSNISGFCKEFLSFNI